MPGRVDVVTFGEVMTLLLGPAGVPLRGAARLDVDHAGAEANVAVGLARLGHVAAFQGRLGDDVFGHRIAAALRGEGVLTGALTFDPERPTGLLIRDAVLGRPITVSYHRAGSAAAALEPAHLDEATITGARLLHLTGITAALSDSAFAACRRALDVAADAGVPVSFDPNVRLRLAPRERWAEIVTELAGRADIVLSGADDVAVAIGADDPFTWFHDRGARIVVIKDGVRGATESTGGERVHQPALPVPVVDPVGAGDAFGAGWISGWLRGLPPARRMAEAAAVAACAVTARGDTAGLPDPQTRDALLGATTDVSR